MLPPPASSSSSSSARATLSSLSSKRSSNFLTKPIIRWIILGCTVLVLMWFLGPLFSSGSGVSDGWGLGFGEGGTRPGKGYYPALEPVVHDDVAGDVVWEKRKEEVRDAMRHAWKGYMDYAYPHDELMSVSGEGSDKYNGWSVTMFDALDTLYIMGLRVEFDHAIELIKGRLSSSSTSRKFFFPTKPRHFAPFFETVIRYLGGLLSAYALSEEPILKDLADELGQVLIPAFQGTGSGLPAYSVSVNSSEIQTDSNKPTVLFAEATSCQLEFKYLAKLTGNREYYRVAEGAMEVFYNASNVASTTGKEEYGLLREGLFHDTWSMEEGRPVGSHFTIGATADSGYEYLLKQWIQSGDEKARKQYIHSMNGIIHNLLFLTPAPRSLLYVIDIDHGRSNHRLEHLSCYLPGVLALGAAVLPSTHDFPTEMRELHRWAAEGLARTCASTYVDMGSGLGPDQVQFQVGGNVGHRLWIKEVEEWKREREGGPPGTGAIEAEKEPEKRGYYNARPDAYLLRPETVESLFILSRTSADPGPWREAGYAIFSAIVKHCKTPYGFASVHGVDAKDSEDVMKVDDMPSWFLAETLKYLYLLFDTSPDALVVTGHEPGAKGRGERWVFNTEAHPLPVFEWTGEERGKFSVSS